MTTTHAINIILTAPQTSSAFGGDDVWLRMEQIRGDDLATAADIAEVVDELYHVDPCLEPAAAADAEEARATMPDNKTLADLLAAAKAKLDIAECERRKTGDYEARVKIIRSHINPPEENIYTLKPSVGRITGTTLTNETLTQTINIRNQSSLTLDYPVPQDEDEEWPGTAKWLGSVWTDKEGAISPPVVTGYGRQLSWPVACNGTLLVRFPTVYDVATVEVPGIPGAVVGSVGKTQDCTLRAFYRFQVYEAEITAVNTDTTADEDSLAAVCGWADLDGSGTGSGSGSGGTGSATEDDDDDQDAADDESPPTGCISPNSTLSSPAFYRRTCCQDPPFALPDCSVTASARPVAELSPEEQASRKRNSGKKINFVAVGPGPDGCGRLFTHQQVNQKSCCDHVVAMEPDPDNPTTIITSVELSVFHGKADIPWEWKCSGGLQFSNGLTTLITRDRRVTVLAVNLCQNNLVRVNDTCSQVSMPLAGDVEPLEINDTDDLVVAPGGEIGFTATGGTLPLDWTGNNDLTLIGIAGRAALFSVSEDFCGTADVYVTDACGQIATATVRSTDGEWQEVTVDFTDGMTDFCSPGPISTAGGSTNIGASQVNLEKISGKWRVRTVVGYSGSGGGCPNGNDLGGLEYACIEMYKEVGAQGALIGGRCCLEDETSCSDTNESLVAVHKWVCSA